MFLARVDGGIDAAIEALKKRELLVVERLGRRGNRDERMIVQDWKHHQALVSFMTDGTQTVVCFEKMVDPQGRLF